MTSPETLIDGRVSLYTGDVREVLRTIASASVDCVVTSPPYWGLRDYGVDGQIGLEPTLGEHLAVMVDVFEEVRRVLKPTGTLWLNYGDCYAATPNGRSAAACKETGTDDRTFRDKPFSTVGPIQPTPQGAYPESELRRRFGEAPRAATGPVYERQPESRQGGRRGRSGNLGNGGINGAAVPEGRVIAGGYLKPKDLCMIPNRLAIALQDAGWWVRSEIVWGKTNPMPDSSGAYRPSTAHEKIFLLTPSADADVWRARDTGEMSFAPDLSERCPLVTQPDRLATRWIRTGSYYDAEAVRVVRSTADDGKAPDGWDTGAGGHGSFHRAGREKGARVDKQRGHSRRHAGFNDRWDGMSREEQTAGGRYLRNYEPAPPVAVWPMATQAFAGEHFATFPTELAERCILAGCPRGGLVLDPFGGAGTTALVAARHSRRGALIELNPEYARIARERICAEWRVRSDLPAEASLPPLPLLNYGAR